MFRLAILSVFLFVVAGCGSAGGGPPPPPSCGPSTCSGGCCTNGVCQLGTAPSACGFSGGLCQACQVYQVCSSHACRVDPNSRWSYGVVSARVPARTDGSQALVWFVQDGRASTLQPGPSPVWGVALDYTAQTLLLRGATFQFFDRQPGPRDVPLTTQGAVLPTEAEFGLFSFTRTFGSITVTFLLRQ